MKSPPCLEGPILKRHASQSKPPAKSPKRNRQVPFDRSSTESHTTRSLVPVRASGWHSWIYTADRILLQHGSCPGCVDSTVPNPELNGVRNGESQWWMRLAILICEALILPLAGSLSEGQLYSEVLCIMDHDVCERVFNPSRCVR